MIITITPFPSIEYIYDIEELHANCKLSSKNVSLNILSKGVYSAQMMKILQEEPILISSFGGFAGKSIKHYLDKAKVKSDIVWTDYETPHQVKITLSTTSDYYTLCSEEAFTIEKELLKLSYKLKNHIKKVSTLVISGRLPIGQDSKIFNEWIQEGKMHNVKTLISTGQRAVFEHVLEEKPYALMFTLSQLNELGYDITSKEVILEQLVPLFDYGIHYIGVYLKEQGALMLSKNKYCSIESPYLSFSKNNTAASGAFLGAFAIGINRKYELERFAKLCLCAASAAHCHVNESICTRKDIENQLKKTKIKQLML